MLFLSSCPPSFKEHQITHQLLACIYSCLSNCLSICLSICLSVCLFGYLCATVTFKYAAYRQIILTVFQGRRFTPHHSTPPLIHPTHHPQLKLPPHNKQLLHQEQMRLEPSGNGFKRWKRSRLITETLSGSRERTMYLWTAAPIHDSGQAETHQTTQDHRSNHSDQQH